jgi:phospholipase C
MRRITIAGAAFGLALFASNLGHAPAKASGPLCGAALCIRHVIVLYQENHSFDNVLGYWCAQTGHCLGMPAKVTLKTGTGTVVVTPTQAPDIVPNVDHSVASQRTAIDGGVMNGWGEVSGCAAPTYTCVSYYTPTQEPNLINLASHYAISDMTFSEADSPSWGGHLYAVAATNDGFTGDNPGPPTAGPGWGCDSDMTTIWINPTTHKPQREPSCVPDPSLSNPNGGAFEPTPVSYVPTIMDRLDAASLPWKVYATTSATPSAGGGPAYIWATCPYFAECLDTSQRKNLVPTDNVLTDAAKGTLPAFGLVLPSAYSDKISAEASQHNEFSMAVGDNWIGALTTALENGPEWSSTALFITYDDCGCFYDQVVPGTNPDGSQRGVRVPLVIVSPYAVAGHVDTTPTTFAGILAYVERNFGLPPLGVNDAAAYPFTKAFNYTQVPLAPVRMVQTPVTQAQRMAGANLNDPT